MISLLLVTVFAFTGCAKAAASVNGNEIKSSEVDFYIDFIKTQNPELAGPGNEETLKMIEFQVTEALVINKLLEAYAQQNDMAVTEQEYENELSKLKAMHATEEEFLQELKANNLTMEFLSKELRMQVLRNKVFDKETADVIATETEMLEYYENNKDIYFKVEEQARLGHILIRFEGENGDDLTGIPAEEELLSKSDAFQKISDIKNEIENGASFEDLARKYSQDPFSAENGGEMGFIGKGQLVEEFEEAAFLLKDGEISDIVETVFGYHIIKMYEYMEASYMAFDEAKEDIQSYIEYVNKNEKWEKFVAALQDAADIKYFNKSEPEAGQ
jgi:foldase protein PrsA